MLHGDFSLTFMKGSAILWVAASILCGRRAASQQLGIDAEVLGCHRPELANF